MLAIAELLEILAAVLAASWTLTWFVRRLAVQRGVLDHPNARSSHSVPTPRGGGLAIVVSSLLGVLLLALLGQIDRALALALLCGGFLVGLVGGLDDRGVVSVRVRFCLHAIAAMWAVFALGGLPPLRFGQSAVDLGLFGDVLGVIAIMWTLNLFNFMDGIDGIAASEAIFVCVAGAWLGSCDTAWGAVPFTGSIVAAAAAGFLIWNWPPARIFMGDVGSGYLGYVIAVLAFAASRQNGVMILVWLILGGTFFVDATVTVVRRFSRGERVTVAHRSHAYQWLSRRWQSHLRVTILITAINVCWLLPMAWLCLLHSTYAALIAALALIPLVICALVTGAGRSEQRP